MTRSVNSKYYSNSSELSHVFILFQSTITLISARQRSCGKVMFSVVCVCHSICPQGSHVTITYDALDLTVQGPPVAHLPDIRHGIPQL